MNKIYTTLVFTAILIVMYGCEIESKQSLPDRSYELVWSDEFDGDSLSSPNNTKWTFDLGTGQNGWGNNELQTYTNRPENISLDGKGHLKITAIKDASGRYTSARINTEGLFAQQYGRIEARIKTPTGAGIWPAFWMLGSNRSTATWPQCGEIDIMEQRGQNSNITVSSLHGPGYFGAQPLTKNYGLQNNRFDADFNLYAVEWGKQYVDFFVNDFLFARFTPADAPGEWVFNQPFFLILNVAVGGNFVGQPNTYTPFPNSMTIDYVRVYKEL